MTSYDSLRYEICNKIPILQFLKSHAKYTRNLQPHGKISQKDLQIRVVIFSKKHFNILRSTLSQASVAQLASAFGC